MCQRHSDCITEILLMHLQCQITLRKMNFSNSKIYGLTVRNTHTHSVIPRAKPNRFLGLLISSHAGMQCHGCNNVHSGCVLSAQGLRQQCSALAERRKFRPKALLSSLARWSCTWQRKQWFTTELQWDTVGMGICHSRTLAAGGREPKGALVMFRGRCSTPRRAGMGGGWRSCSGLPTQHS